MKKHILFTDLDNTLIYSYKHDIGLQKVPVEYYQGKIVSYITEKSKLLLTMFNKKVEIVPTSTRTIEQYSRINLGFSPRYALVCNGGILLENGIKDEEWYTESIRFVFPVMGEIRKSIDFLEKDSRRKFELRFIEDLFVFTKCNEPEKVVDDLKKIINEKKVNVFSNGEKVYAVPTVLSKGNALLRLRNKLNPQTIIAAGDSEFDISMVEEADYGIVPHGFCEKYGVTHLIETGSDLVFSDAMLSEALKLVENSREK